jgi:hypothetical protein
MEINVRVDTKQLTRSLKLIQKRHIPMATAKALTFTAERIEKANKKIIPQIFSNPTKVTRNSVWKQPATPNRLYARVFIKDVRGEEKWLMHHVKGGARKKKGSERRGRIGDWTAMGKNAPRNQYGNITRARYSKMFADVQRAGLYSGDYASTKTKAQGGTKKIKYFMRKGKGGKNVIYMKSGRGGKKITPMLVETKQPTYRKRWPFYKIARSVYKREYDRLFSKQLAREIKKAGF